MTAAPFPTLSRREWAMVLAIAAAALTLRVMMAQGALWLDEAWSAMHAREARTPLGVFLGINHDNNHHLNSLWMQWVGIDAPTVLQRALAIATSTIAILIAAILGRRRDWPTALVAALLFALSPFFAHYGSEARGYAPMMLALLMVLLRVQIWLDGGPRPTSALALWGVFGLLSQLTMVMGLVAVTGWAFLTLARRGSLRAAAVETARTFAPAAIAGALVIGGILLAAKLNSGGMRFGSLEPYTLNHELKALFSITSYTVGVGQLAIWPAIVLLAVFALAIAQRGPRLDFYWLALIAFPLAVAVLHPANPGHARYYSLIAVAVALMIADVSGSLIRAGGWRRIAAMAGVALILAASLVEDVRLIRNQRGDPGQAIVALRRIAPQGAGVFVERDSAVPVLAAAGLVAHYPLAITRQECPAAPYLFIDRYNGEQLPDTQRRCGHDYVPIADRRAIGMTNFHWRLFRRR
ncbi:MAG: hypothetical protein FJ335_01570 [Sphingomonadales bacterium]|nr:hypothetical protein [Sphingomonadales bacterium]